METRVDTYDVSKEVVQEGLSEVLFHDNTKNVELIQISCEIII